MLDQLFNWKKYPKSVFYIALPLAALGFILIFLRAAAEWVFHRDPWYIVIALVGCIILLIGLWPLRTHIQIREGKE